MLAVRVESREYRGAGPLAGVYDSGLNRCALTEVHRAETTCAGAPAMSAVSSLPPSSTQTTGEHRPQVGDDIADDLRLIECRNDDQTLEGSMSLRYTQFGGGFSRRRGPKPTGTPILTNGPHRKPPRFGV